MWFTCFFNLLTLEINFFLLRKLIQVIIFSFFIYFIFRNLYTYLKSEIKERILFCTLLFVKNRVVGYTYQEIKEKFDLMS